MKTSIYTRHRFPPVIIRRAVWMYFRFNLSFRDVEELMIERGVDVSYETIRRWIDKFGSTYAKRIKSRSESPSPVWHLDEVYTKINGKMVYLWRAVDDEGSVLDIVVQRRRNTKAAIRLLRKLLKNQGIKPTHLREIQDSSLKRFRLRVLLWATTASDVSGLDEAILSRSILAI